MPPKKTTAKASVATPQTKKKIVAPKARKSRNSLTAKTPSKPSIAKDTKKSVQVSAKGKRGKQNKITPPEIQEMKIKLANEVVQAQFPKQRKCVKNLTVQNVTKKPVLKRKRLQYKKNIETSDSDVSFKILETISSSEESPVAKKKPRIVRKKLDVTDKNTEQPSQSEGKPKPTPRKKLCLNRKKVFQGLTRTVINDYVSESEIKEEIKRPDVQNLEINSNTCELNKNTSELNRVCEVTETQVKDNSRRSSYLGSEFSWTKDLSISSTTTFVTVNSNDFVRIDQKLPVLRLTKCDDQVNIGKEETTTTSTSTSDTTSSASSADESTEYEISNNNIDLNLSISSSSCGIVPDKPISIYDQLLEVLKEFNPEQLNWTSCSNEYANTDDFKARITEKNVFQDETTLIRQWLEITTLSSENSLDNIDNTLTSEVKCDMSAPETLVDFRDDSFSKNLERVSKRHTEDDDDDALSLFAESISGFDISRRSSSFVTEPSKIEEYIPQPIASETFKIPQAVTYNPSKIPEPNITPLNICEKQNADSTSLKMDFVSEVDINNFESHSESSKSESEVPTNVSQHPTSLLSCKPVDLVKSSILRGFCAFNFIYNCKNIKCNFPHIYPDPKLVKDRLTRLNNEKFIQEYLLIRNILKLRRVFGLFCIEECARRNLSRILVQMSIDFVLKANGGSVMDEKLKTEAVERVLLYLNFQDIKDYEELLKYQVGEGVLLCDVFLKVIGQSQNFSRFRTVFINLTMFMCRIGRVFDRDVVCQILERVCILPYEFSLNRTLIEILKRTDGTVFENSMCGLLESRLVNTNKNLYEELVRLKQQQMCVDRSSAERDIRYSPDTTNYDNKITRPNEMFPPIQQITFPNHYNKKPFKRRTLHPQKSANRNFMRKPMFSRPMNSHFASHMPSPSLNPGHILSKFNKKM